MANIYQRIYDADMSAGSGVQAILNGTTPPPNGHVVVTEAADDTRVRNLLPEVFIPPAKRTSYDLAEALFDNYNLLSSVPDEITPQEAAEVDILLEHIVNRGPMSVARNFIETESGRPLSDPAWYALVKETWFRPFAIGSSPTRSGFEHVFLGEHKAGKNTVGGLHWWYYYFTKMDDLDYGGAKYGNNAAGVVIPEIATMTFSWQVPGRTITKPIGGFFVGLSVEGLMAMGMVRASNVATAPNIAVIQGFEVELKMFKSGDGRSVNTFYPIFRRALVTPIRPVDPPVKPVVRPPPPPPPTGKTKGGIRLVSVVSNPDGHDAGRELVTLLNVLPGTDVNLRGWRVMGPNKSALVLGDVVLESGNARTFDIPASGSLQLSNKGGVISVVGPDGDVAHALTYDSSDAKVQGAVLVWDGAANLAQVGV